MKLKRKSVIHIDTDQACKASLTFVPGEKPYIHFSATDIEGYRNINGFIADKDVSKLKRFVESLP